MPVLCPLAFACPTDCKTLGDVNEAAGACRPVVWTPPSKQKQTDAGGRSVSGALPGESAPWAPSTGTCSLLANLCGYQPLVSNLSLVRSGCSAKNALVMSTRRRRSVRSPTFSKGVAPECRRASLTALPTCLRGFYCWRRIRWHPGAQHSSETGQCLKPDNRCANKSGHLDVRMY